MAKFTYIIVKSTNSHIVHWNDVVETSLEHVRYNSDKSRFLLKFIGDCPIWAANYPLYNHKQILLFLKNNTW